jgi:hypothetical protein
MWTLMRDYIYLDNIEWLAQVSQIDGCPQCRTEKISYGPDFSYPYVKHLTNSEFDKLGLITRPFASKIREIALKARELKGSNPRLVIFVDDRYCNSIDLAKALIRDAKLEKSQETPEQDDFPYKDITTDEYLKLSFLFDGNLADPVIQANKEQYLRLHKELVNDDLFNMMEAHKYDYKCFPIHHLQSNRMLIN